ncbi:MAG: MFS transporter [Variovorax sp.]
MDDMRLGAPPAARLPGAVWAVIFAGVAAALHMGKLSPALPVLQQALGVSLVQAGFLLSLVQGAGMTLGLAAGLAADSIGLKRSMLIGLAIITLASIGGAQVQAGPHAVTSLLALRALEGVGFLLTVMPGPGLLRALVPVGRDKLVSGLWGSYFPLGVALALLAGPALIAAMGWTGWWWVASLVSTAAALSVAFAVPDDPRGAGAGDNKPSAWRARLMDTVRTPGLRRVALAFAVYSSQWVAVIGFLPVIYTNAGVPAGWTAVLTAVAAAMNIAGNLVGGTLLQRGVAAPRLLVTGFALMMLGGLAAFSQWGQGGDALALPPALRYGAVCLFSLAGGVVPASLFMLVVRLAPGPQSVSTAVGFMQQTSALGQFAAPPIVGWVAHAAGGWQLTWVLTGACSLCGIWLATRLGRAEALTLRRGAA